ncbi:GDP-L-fucose synthase family protein [Herbaspirillum camelliae]|uniref:GDP-L-fucose synthase family protein n=1 Tax=Herbaspirillum camelliae TaxID=1892903 RepID=UPI0009FAACCF|nr:GDP-L-fucose synthase [Herbaspirillum camelliae]
MTLPTPAALPPDMPSRDASIFVAGHAGLIGSAILRALQQAGYRKLITRTRAQLELRDKQQVDAFFEAERPDYVMLAAGKVGGILENQSFPADFINANLAISLNVLEAAHRCGVKRLVMFGSSCMYPRETAQPMAETALLSGHPEPTSLPYAIAKLAGVQLCLAYNRQYGQQRFIPLIPNSAYGPNDNFDPKSGHVLSSLMARFHQAKLDGAEAVTLWGSGTPRREFIHADDIAAAALLMMREQLPALTLPLNVGSGSDISIRELAQVIAGVVGYEGRLEWDSSKPDGALRKLLDSSLMHQQGWRTQVGFAEGLRDTYAWYVQNKAGRAV